MKKKIGKRKTSEYFSKSEIVEIRHICNGKIVDQQGFNINNKNDHIKLFELLCDKLGFNYQAYKRFKSIDWQ